MNKLKSRFISMISHELRTPLSTITSSIELMKLGLEIFKEDVQKERQKTHLNRVNAQVYRLTRIISDILTLENYTNGNTPTQLEKVNIQNFLNNLIEDYFKDENIAQIQTHMPTKDLVVETDSAALSHVVKNIIENAIKYSSESNKKPILKLIQGEEMYTIEVRDYGMGIPEEEQKHIFDSFFRAKNVANIKGTGLGLNIVQEFVKKLGGKVDFKSKVGKGTTFSIKLPIRKLDK